MGCGSSQSDYAPAGDAKAPSAAAIRLETTALPAEAPDAKKVAVVLPGKKYAGLITKDSQFTYHLLDEPTYSMLDPFGFDADAFVEAAIEYCRKNSIEGVFGFDCFPSLLASIINESLSLQGPSFQSVFLCANKYYMRKVLSPSLPVTRFDPHDAPKPPEVFPVVVKQTDCQFYVGTWILQNLEDWERLLRNLQAWFRKEALDRRKQFYAKWQGKLGKKALAENWQDIALFHVEPYLQGREHQIEVVVDGSELLVADTGDLIKTGDILVMFVTPGSFDIPIDWAKGVAGKLRDLGYKNQAMDIEFVFTESGPELVEINSRYSYMGWASFFENRCGDSKSVLNKKPDLRNLENRTLSCLGCSPTRFPSDEDAISKLAVMMYTQKTGPVQDILDLTFLDEHVKAGLSEAWAPKAPFLNGRVAESDLSYPGGWCKLGCLLMTARRQDFEATNRRIADFQKQFFRSDSYILAQDDEIGREVDKRALEDSNLQFV